MIILKKFLFRNANPDTGGGAPIDRGDNLTPEVVETPAVVVKDDAAVKALEEELAAEIVDKTEDGDAASDGDGADTKPAKDSRIPAARHKEILEKERAKSTALAAEVAQLKQRGNLAASNVDATAEFAAVEADVLKLEDEYANLLTDGEIKKATAVMAKIRAAERYMADSRAELKIKAATVQAQETSRYETALTRIETAFPELNPDHDNYDEKVMHRVARLSRANQADGMTPVAALQDAVEAIVGAESAQQLRATTVTPRAEKDVGAERKAAAVAKAVAAVGKTPASLSRAGIDSDKLGGGALDAAAVMKMSQKEFAGLSESDLAKMRGDAL